MPPEEAGRPPSQLFLLAKEPNCKAEADNLMSVVHLHGQYLTPIESEIVLGHDAIDLLRKGRLYLRGWLSIAMRSRKRQDCRLSVSDLAEPSFVGTGWLSYAATPPFFFAWHQPTADRFSTIAATSGSRFTQITAPAGWR